MYIRTWLTCLLISQEHIPLIIQENSKTTHVRYYPLLLLTFVIFFSSWITSYTIPVTPRVCELMISTLPVMYGGRVKL
jgi:hypothetical protein